MGNEDEGFRSSITWMGFVDFKDSKIIWIVYHFHRIMHLGSGFGFISLLHCFINDTLWYLFISAIVLSAL